MIQHIANTSNIILSFVNYVRAAFQPSAVFESTLHTVVTKVILKVVL